MKFDQIILSLIIAVTPVFNRYHQRAAFYH